MRKNWTVLALGMSVAIVGFAAGEAEAMISSSLAVGTLSKAALYRKQRVSGSDVCGLGFHRVCNRWRCWCRPCL